MTHALLIADAPGHLLERIARSWVRYAGALHRQVLCSAVVPAYVRCRAGEASGLIHWVDPLGFQVCAGAVRVPQVAMVHHLSEAEIPGMLRALRLADGITTTSRRWKDRLEALTGRDVTLIPYAVDAARFVPQEDRDALRARSGIPATNFVVGYVGKATANAYGRKGLDVLQRVLEGAADRWPDLTVLLVGPGWESLAAHLLVRGVDVRHRAFETTEETAQMYPLMDALLVTSVEEGGPCTILESMACGVPAVTSNVGHVPEVVEDGVTGFTCESCSPEEYLVKLALIRDGAECAVGMGTRARAFILAERDEPVVLPAVDFGAIYRAAREHFAARSSGELAMRRVALLRLAGRYVARVLLRRGAAPTFTKAR